MKSWARELALGLLLATAIPAPVLAAQSAEQILLDKANYWRLKDRPDLATDALQQLLSINPNQPEALYQFGIVKVQQAKLDDARAYLGRLRRAAPSSPRIADLENAIRAGQVSPSELSEARRLAQTGQFSQAAEKYQQTFQGAPPPTFGVEYYMTLAGTPRWGEARTGLERLVQNSPNDSKAKLALAQVYTYRAETRARGVRMLAQLSDDSVVGAEAARSWKQSLMWLGAGPEDRQLYNQYFAKFPNDAEVRAHLAEVGKAGAPGPGARPSRAGRPSAAAGPPGEAGPPVSPGRTRSDTLRTEGQALESRGDAAGAAAKYQEAVAADPSNPWARLDFARFLARQGNAAQGFQIVDPAASGGNRDSFHAAALFYSEQNRWTEALALLDQIPASQRGRNIVETRERLFITGEIARAKQLAKTGGRAAARNLLVSLYRHPPQTAEKTRLIADALADIGDFNEALALARPNPATLRSDIRAGLSYAGLLVRAGRDAEAVSYIAQAESGPVPADARRDLERLKGEIAAKRADRLRERGDLAGAYDQLSALLTAYPNEPTLLLAAGRIYAAAGYTEIAMRFVDAAYRQAPGDLGVLRGAVGGAIQAGDTYRARAYLLAGMELHPNNPRLYYLAAEISRAEGDNGAAMYHLAVARRLDLGGVGPYEPVAAATPGAVPAPAGTLPANPFRQSAAEPAMPSIVPAAVQSAEPARPVMLAAARTAVSATDATPIPLTGSSAPAGAGGDPLVQHAVSADSDDLIVPPGAGDRPQRRAPALPAARVASGPPAWTPQALTAPPPPPPSSPACRTAARHSRDRPVA